MPPAHSQLPRISPAVMIVKIDDSAKLDFVHFKLCETQLTVFVLEDSHKSTVSAKDVI